MVIAVTSVKRKSKFWICSKTNNLFNKRICFRYERTSKLLSCKNKATPTLSEKANFETFYSCFLSYCFETLQYLCKRCITAQFSIWRIFDLVKYRATCAFFFPLDGKSNCFTYQTNVLIFFSNDNFCIAYDRLSVDVSWWHWWPS